MEEANYSFQITVYQLYSRETVADQLSRLEEIIIPSLLHVISNFQQSVVCHLWFVF